MIISELKKSELYGVLTEGLVFNSGPFVFYLTSPLTDISANLKILYADYSFKPNFFWFL